MPTDETTPSTGGPVPAPVGGDRSTARVLAAVAVVVAGACGGLIGWAVVDLQCDGSCQVPSGIGAVVGALLAAAGTAVIAVLAVSAMAEWRQQEGRRRAP